MNRGRATPGSRQTRILEAYLFYYELYRLNQQREDGGQFVVKRRRMEGKVDSPWQSQGSTCY